MTRQTKFKCPDCEREYNDAAHLGIHRRAAHGIPGSSANSIKAREKRKKAAEAALKAEPRQKRKYTKRSNQLAIIPSAVIASNGHQPEKAHRQGYTDAIPDALIAVTSGRFIELCRSVAHEHDLPPRMFAARVAAFIYGTTVR